MEKVKIFGSRAKNTFHKRSDIDLVLFAKSDSNGFHLAAAVLFDLEDLDIPYHFDVKVYHDINYLPLKKHIDVYSQVFYDSKRLKF